MKKIVLLALLTTSFIHCMETTGLSSLLAAIAMEESSDTSLKEKFIAYKIPILQIQSHETEDLTPYPLPSIKEKKTIIFNSYQPNIQTSEGEFICNLCKTSFKNNGTLVNHCKSKPHRAKLKLNNNKENITVPRCPVKECHYIIHKNTKLLHINWHSGKINDQKLCNICQLAFVSKQSLKQHYASRRHKENELKINQ